jgi:hypothetical protein
MILRPVIVGRSLPSILLAAVRLGIVGVGTDLRPQIVAELVIHFVVVHA